MKPALFRPSTLAWAAGLGALHLCACSSSVSFRPGADGTSTRASAGGGSSSTTASGGSGGSGGVGGAMGCHGAVAATSDVFDPGEVYMLGTTQPGDGLHDALAHWSSPGSAVGGLDPHSDGRYAVHPGDGHMLYVSLGKTLRLRAYRCTGGCVATWENSVPDTPDDDEDLPIPGCTDDFEGEFRFLQSPTGTIFHTCASAGANWLDSTGNIAYGEGAAGALLALGYDELALTDEAVVRLDTGESAPFAGLPEGEMVALRATEGGFLVGVVPPDESGPAHEVALYRIDSSGATTVVGVFTKFDSPDHSFGAMPPRLDACNALFEVGSGSNGQVVLRRTLDGAADIVFEDYDESEGVLPFHVYALVTGP